MRIRHRLIGLSLLFLSAVAGARVDPERAAELGRSLTPMGSEAGANADGSIPAWQPMIDHDFQRGDNPYADDEPLYTIRASNLANYENLLTQGHRALFRTFPETFHMPVYPSRRGAAYPQWFLDSTRDNATTVELTNSGHGFCCAAQGFPFPVPTNGLEVMWNHIMRYNTRGFRGYVAAAATTPAGDHVVERAYLELAYAYNTPGMSAEQLGNQNLYVMSKTVAPASKAGSAYLLHVPIDRVTQTTGVWVFSVGENRTRRIGEVGYDNPLFDGLMTQDQVDMFNGPLDRYTLKLVGKRELIVPYNSYALYDPEVAYEDIITPGHIQQQLTRYEKHRVWVIEAQVREGISHRYKKRVFYVDEDSWIVLAQDIYDERDQFWRFAESHSVNFPQVPVMINGVQVHYDLQSRRYAILNLTNEEKELIEYDWTQTPGYFTPSNLKRFAATRQ
ncbi:DUF1329 domain-containing protein [Panacagrimonas sp.]|uniref:DUF1329 domain-containing protein n=1 Tax=Panacagrimonas sp. TaxID=2480088 RepID=UPI003B51D08E